MYFPSITFLRGVASLAVAWFHFTNGDPNFLQNGWLKMSGSYGWVGVDIFFIISGFVIPWSLCLAKYRLASFGRFIARRIVRLDPPYFASIILVLTLNYLSSVSPHYQGRPFSLDMPVVLAHLAYLNAFFSFEWLIDIYWSLAVEFQYYILIAFLFPLIANPKPFTRRLTLCLFLIIFLIFKSEEPFKVANNLITNYIPLFMVGILGFQLKAGLIKQKEFFISLVPILFLSKAYIFFMPLLALITICLILFVKIESKFTDFFGEISYSLYLIHLPVGGRVVNLMKRFMSEENVQLFGPFTALIICVIFAYIFYRLIEKPSLYFAKKIVLRPISAEPRVAYAKTG